MIYASDLVFWVNIVIIYLHDFSSLKNNKIKGITSEKESLRLNVLNNVLNISFINS